MSPAEHNELTGALQRGKLTAQQEKQIEDYLATHPGEREFWEEEMRLSQVLGQVPDLPVSSNFTARVREAVRQEQQGPLRTSPGWGRSLFSHWVPKLATALAVVSLGLFSFH